MQPTLRTLRAAVIDFGGYAQPDKSWDALLATTAPRVNPGRAAHRRALLVWLNAWGCRIRYPRDGEPDVFDTAIAAWWRRHGRRLPEAGASLTGLSEQTIATLGDSYAELAASRVAPTGRTLGPTAASKMLYALRPGALMPWDEGIALRLHGKRDGAAYADHLRTCRDWAQRLLAEAGMDEDELSEAFGCPGRTLVKMLDDYCYIVFTRDARTQDARTAR